MQDINSDFKRVRRVGIRKPKRLPLGPRRGCVELTRRSTEWVAKSCFGSSTAMDCDIARPMRLELARGKAKSAELNAEHWLSPTCCR